MAVAEEASTLFNKDNQENWLLVDSDASLSYALFSKDCTPTAMVPLLNNTECSLLLVFFLLIQVHLVVLLKTFERNGCC